MLGNVNVIQNLIFVFDVFFFVSKRPISQTVL